VITRTSGKDCKKGKNRSVVTKIAKTNSQFCFRRFILLVTVARRMAKYKINKTQIPVPKPDSIGLTPLTSSVISMQNQMKLKKIIGNSINFKNAKIFGYFGTLLFITALFLSLIMSL